MTTEKFLEGYSGQSTDELIALETDYRIDSLVLAFEQAIDQKAAKLGDQSLSREEQIILAVEALEREVNNGGYDQFFVNSKDYVPTVVEALRHIGCPITAELTQRAIDALGIQGPLSAEAVDAVIYDENAERDEVLGQCDAAYFRAPEDIAGCLFGFVKRNKDRIRLA